MNYRMLPVGNSTYVSVEKIVAIVKFDSVKIKKEIATLRESENSYKLIDSTKRKQVKAVLILENGTHILSCLLPETLVKKLSGLKGDYNEHE